MAKFPEIMIVRYYESDGIDLTYSDNGSVENISKLEKKLEQELDNDKHLETYEIFYKGKNIKSEEKREN